MTKIQDVAKEWSEGNSSPGIDGLDEAYEVLIAVQTQAFEAGYRFAIEEAAEVAEKHGKDWVPVASKWAAEVIADQIRALAEEEEDNE